MHDTRSAQSGGVPRRFGRARDSDIDARILAAARRQLATLGYEAMSVASVAEEAGTTRQALYRRWSSKADLADAAVAGIDDSAEPGAAPSVPGAASHPFHDLVRELTDFQRGITRPGRLSLAGTMLQESTEPEVQASYRAKVVAPRRQRLRIILERAAALGLIDTGADLDVAVAMATGNWYGRELAGDPAPAHWPRRSAELVWRAVGGGTPPPAS